MLTVLALGACSGAASARQVPSATAVRALLAHSGGWNVAVTADHADDPRLRPHHLAAPPGLVQTALLETIDAMPRWRTIGINDDVIWATRTTHLFRFVDDLYILVAADSAGTVVRVRSASRLGRRDFGQNRRNIAELWRALDRWVDAHGPVPSAPLGAVVAARR